MLNSGQVIHSGHLSSTLNGHLDDGLNLSVAQADRWPGTVEERDRDRTALLGFPSALGETTELDVTDSSDVLAAAAASAFW